MEGRRAKGEGGGNSQLEKYIGENEEMIREEERGT